MSKSDNLKDNNKSAGQKGKSRNRRGSALILTMFIMAGMLVVAMGGAYVVLLGIKAGGIQAQSTKAYFAAEAGAERLLWEIRWNDFLASGGYDPDPEAAIINGNLTAGLNYEIYYMSLPLIFQSVGEYQSTRRSVEIKM